MTSAWLPEDERPIHVVPTWEPHDTDHGHDCICEPRVENGPEYRVPLIIHEAMTEEPA